MTEYVSVVLMVVVEESVETAASTAVVVWITSEVFGSYLVTVKSLYWVTDTVAVGLVTVDHVVVGWPHAEVVVR